MASFAMSKVVAFLCMALLVVVQVAHVESARLLRNYDDTQVTAQTFPTQSFPDDGDVFATNTETPVTSDKVTEYNYNNPTEELATTDEGVYATEGILVGEITPPDSYVFDAQHEDEALDEPVFNPNDSPTTTQDFGALDAQMANQDAVLPVYESAVDAQEFEFQESTGTDDGSQWDSPGFFAFDDALPFGN